MINTQGKTQLDKALTIEKIEKGLWKGVSDPNYQTHVGMFGGLTAALLLNGVIHEEDGTRRPTSLTVNYLNPIPSGSELVLRVLHVGGGRSINHWRSELVSENNMVYAMASVIMASRRPSRGFTEDEFPECPLPENLGEFIPLGSFGKQTPNRIVYGFPPFAQESTKSLAWARERSGRKIDELQLTYLSDVFPPRIWYTETKPIPIATVTLSVYFYATPIELDEVGDDFLLLEVTGTKAQDSMAGSHLRLWGRNRQLLATSEQLAWFKQLD